MKELTADIREAVAIGEPKHLREASVKWANWCLNNLDDVLLRKGLEISAAIADFLNEIEREEQ